MHFFRGCEGLVGRVFLALMVFWLWKDGGVCDDRRW